jgi:Anti-sigma-28 factor, FlgM
VTGANPQPERAFEREQVSRLKQQIERRTYRVDPDAVAQEILFKLRMIQLGRRGMLGPSAPGGEGPSGENSEDK